MKVVKQLKHASHAGLVFFDAHSAKTRDLKNAIGRYDESADEFMLLGDETNITKKITALIECGVSIHLAKQGSNFYCNFDDRYSSTPRVTEAVVSTDLPTTVDSPSPSPSPKSRKVIYRDIAIGVIEEDEFYLEDEYEELADKEFDFYEYDDDGDVYISNDVRSTGLDILDVIIDKAKAKTIKEQTDVVNEFYSHLSYQDKQANDIIAQTLNFYKDQK